MKIIKEHLFEKFEEDSDPIKDMGIGEEGIYKNLKRGDILQFKRDLNFLPDDGYKEGKFIILSEDIVLNPPTKNDNMRDYIVYALIEKKYIKNFIDPNSSDFSSSYRWYMNFHFFKKTFRKVDKNIFK